MSYSEHTAQYDNKPYQVNLAHSLLGTMDRQDAIDFCVQNEWLGVLETLLIIGQRDAQIASATT